MKFGINTFVWVSPCTTEAIEDLAPNVRSMGFDILEIAVENPDLIDIQVVKEILRENQLEAIVCGAFGPNRNIWSSIRKSGENARKYLLWLIDAAHNLAPRRFVVPCISSVGKDHMDDPGERQEEWQRAVSGIKGNSRGGAAERHQTRLEPLNRFALPPPPPPPATA